MNLTLEVLHKLVFFGLAALFIFQSILLFARSKNNVSCKTMALLELFWGTEYLIALIFMYTIKTPEIYQLLREQILVISSLFISLTIFFPAQILIPHWLTWKRIFLLLLPVVVMAGLYYGIMFLLGESPEKIRSFKMLRDSFWHFNVWFRFVLLIVDIICVVYVLRWLTRHERKYTEWKKNNVNEAKSLDIFLMPYYNYIVIGSFFFYMGVLFMGGRVAVICHGMFMIICFSYLFYKTLFYDNSSPKSFFGNQEQKTEAMQNVETTDNSLDDEEQKISEQNFEDKLPDYKDLLENWMNDERPYLFKDFKLSDVTSVLPLNRSYLSRVFNQGFGKNFSEVVRGYRVDYSKMLMKQNPRLSMREMADLCGFHSESAFIRAFKIVTGVTPNQFKIHLICFPDDKSQK